jgi:hypothetical protein
VEKLRVKNIDGLDLELAVDVLGIKQQDFEKVKKLNLHHFIIVHNILIKNHKHW